MPCNPFGLRQTFILLCPKGLNSPWDGCVSRRASFAEWKWNWRDRWNTTRINCAEPAPSWLKCSPFISRFAHTHTHTHARARAHTGHFTGKPRLNGSQGGHKPGKLGRLRDFSEHGKLREFARNSVHATSGKNCNKQSIFSSSFKYLCKTAVDWINRITVVLLELMWNDPWWRSLLHYFLLQ